MTPPREGAFITWVSYVGPDLGFPAVSEAGCQGSPKRVGAGSRGEGEGRGLGDRPPHW